MVGNAHHAHLALLGANAHVCRRDDEAVLDGWPRYLGAGTTRVLWRVADVVYKVCYDPSGDANEREHRALSTWRGGGMWCAPETTLWRIPDERYVGAPVFVVLAMPYLPDDGSTADIVELQAVHEATQGVPVTVHVLAGCSYVVGADEAGSPSG